jgi:hypothetical protein
MADKKFKAIIIVEIMGRPAEHAKESLKQHVKTLGDKKGVRVISEVISDAKKIEEAKQQELFTCFAEVELETDTFFRLIEIIFEYMPSSVELLEPEEFTMDLPETTTFLNNLTGRLHRYDEVTKIAQAQAQQLMARVQEMGKNGQVPIEKPKAKETVKSSKKKSSKK